MRTLHPRVYPELFYRPFTDKQAPFFIEELIACMILMDWKDMAQQLAAF